MVVNFFDVDRGHVLSGKRSKNHCVVSCFFIHRGTVGCSDHMVGRHYGTSTEGKGPDACFCFPHEAYLPWCLPQRGVAAPHYATTLSLSAALTCALGFDRFGA